MAAHVESAPSMGIVIEHMFDAPRATVFRAWLEREHVADWFAPDGYDVTHCEIDARVGGRWRVEFASADGDRHVEHGEYRTIAEPDELAFTLTQQTADGRSGPQTLVTARFYDDGPRTRLRFEQTGYRSTAMRDANAEGWRECLAKLEKSVARAHASHAADECARREIRALFETWWNAASAKDIDGAMALVAQDVVSYEHDAPLQYRGVDAVRGVCQAGFDAMSGELRWDVPDLEIVVRGDLAVTWGLNRMRTKTLEGPDVELWSRGTRVFRRIDGRWRMVHQHVSFPYDAATGVARTDLTP